VTPSWTPADAGTNDIVIVIDPKMAFGTGEHASTRGALRLLESRVRPGATVLDVGTGSAVLGIAAARLGARVVDAVEMDADALINAHENVAVNDCAGRVHLAEATVDDAWLESRAARYDIIVANILSSVLVPLLPAFGVALRDDGLRTLILGGILETERDVVVAAAERAGFRAASEDREDTWWAGALELRDPHDD
jgi:ribosomal protein L11 methyltransferase